MRMYKPVLWALACCALQASAAASEPRRAAVAEQYFRGVYGCDPKVVEELAAADIVVTYPAFKELFGKAALVGHQEVVAFADHFCRKWTDRELLVHESISDSKEVVLVWSFSARDSQAPGDEPRSAWGGISLIKFARDGRIAAEIGEESTPGPIGRLATTASK
jgi:hypothetical protein